MPEHLIRLRGGWLRLAANASPDHPTAATSPRVTLPITWPEEVGCGGRIRLVRSFGPPPLDSTRECLALRLADVAGLASAHLNGREIARPAPGTTALQVSLRLPLPPRNLLVLDLEFPVAGNFPELLTRPWGTVALVIGLRETQADAAPGIGFEENSGTTPAGNDNDLLGGMGP